MLTLSTMLKLLAGGLAGYALVLAFAWRFQERLAFPAPRGPLPEPAQLGLSGGRRVEAVTSDGVTLRGWYLPPSPPPATGRAPGLLWFPGNAETVGALSPVMRELRPPGMGLVALDYRGYGTSAGRPNEDGIYRDADAAWDLLVSQPEIDPARVAVYGRSVGSVPALHLAVTKPVRALVLDSPFTSARDVAREHYRFLPAFILRLELDNLARARRLRAPLLVLHGTADRIIPFRMGRAVAEAGAARELVAVEGAGHNDLYLVAGRLYREKMHAFLEAVLTRDGG